jgi:hypothetical protein
VASSIASVTRPVLKDLKEALSSTRKPDITHVRKAFMVYTCRPCEYGDDKYQRANYLRAVADGGYTGTPTKADLKRFQAYLRAAASHLFECLDSIELFLSTDPDCTDVNAMRRAAYAEDTDVTPGAKVGPSLLPHVAPACSSLQMAIQQAVLSGLLPADPGRPWDGERSKQMLAAENAKLDKPAADLARVEALRQAAYGEPAGDIATEAPALRTGILPSGETVHEVPIASVKDGQRRWLIWDDIDCDPSRIAPYPGCAYVEGDLVPETAWVVVDDSLIDPVPGARW